MLLDWLAARTYVFPVNCEDPRVDRAHLDIGPADTILTIASGACNAFDYLLEGAEVVAVDTNPHQVYLCELKMALCRTQPYEVAWQVLGQGDVGVLVALYDNELAPHLSTAARAYWDARVHQLRAPFVYTGIAGWAVWVMYRCVGEAWCQRYAWCADYVLPWVAPFAGVPAAQLQKGDHRPHNGRAMIERVAASDATDNYFLQAYRTGRYTQEACPRYLQSDGYARLQRALRSDKMRVATCSMLDAVRLAPAGTYTVASLCDHTDWLDDAACEEEFDTLRRRLHAKDGRIFWRSYDERLPMCSALDTMDVTPCDVKGDRMPLYWGCWVARLRGAGRVVDTCVDTTRPFRV